MTKMFAALVLVCSYSASADYSVWAAHPASVFLQDAVTKAEAVVAGKGDDASKVAPLCAIMKNTASAGYIGGIWLGNYANLASDQAGVKAFVALIPSIAMSKILPSLSNAGSAGIVISTTATERNPTTWAVPARVTANGSTYNVQIIVRMINGKMRVIDGEYFGFSGVGYLKPDYQKKFDAAYQSNRLTPVSDVVKALSSASGFVRCP